MFQLLLKHEWEVKKILYSTVQHECSTIYKLLFYFKQFFTFLHALQYFVWGFNGNYCIKWTLNHDPQMYYDFDEFIMIYFSSWIAYSTWGEDK